MGLSERGATLPLCGAPPFRLTVHLTAWPRVIIPLALDGFPHRITFTGRIHPPGMGKLNVQTSEYVEFREPNNLFSAKLSIAVILSKIQVHCFVSNLIENYESNLCLVAINVLRTFIDLIAFSEGKGIQILLETITMADGTTRYIQYGNPAVNGLCTSVDQLAQYTQLLKIVAPEPTLSLALDDLIMAVTVPDHQAVNCTRAVEGIRNLIAGDDAKESNAWSMFHRTLNSDEQYVQFITNLSRQHRHAKRHPNASGELDEVIRRCWILMDRYLHLRLRNLTELPIDEFPLLTG